MGMMPQSRLLRRVVCCAFLFIVCGLRAAQPPEALALIAKARAFLGGEEALEAIESLRFEGTIEYFDSASRMEVRVLLEKRDRQRSEVRMENYLKVVGIEDLQGWELIIDERGEEPQRSLRIIEPEAFWKNHFSALENLWFHEAFKPGRGRLTWDGESVFEGRLVGRITVDYGMQNRFVRRFDLKTGELVASIGSDGSEVRERRWVVVEGVRFPQVMEYYRDGERTSRLTFEVIEVNPKLDPAIFRLPVF